MIYPAQEFRKLKKENFLFYKTDHHLTDSGCYELYKIILNRIKKDFPDINITPVDKFKISYNNRTRHSSSRNFDRGGNITRALIEDNKTLLKTNYKFYEYKDSNNITVTENWPMGEHVNPNGKHKMFVIANSMIESLIYIMDTSFYSIIKYRFNSSLETPKRKSRIDINGYDPYIKKAKPEILLIILSSGYVFEMEDMYH